MNKTQFKMNNTIYTESNANNNGNNAVKFYRRTIKKFSPKRVLNVIPAPLPIILEEPVTSPKQMSFTVRVNINNTMYILENVYTASQIYAEIRTRYMRYTNQTGAFKKILGKKMLPFTVHYRGKLIRDSDIFLCEYNFHDNEIVVVNFMLMMGGSILLPTYDVVLECEREVLKSIQPKLEIQSIASPISWTKGLDYIKAKMQNNGGDYIIKLIEDIGILMYGITHANSHADYAISMITFVKLRSPGSIFSNKYLDQLTQKFHSIFSQLQVQSAEEFFGVARDYLDKYEQVKSAPIFKKLYKFSMYALSLSLFEKLGVTFDNCRYSELETAAIKRKYHMGVDFIHSMLDTILFLCQRGVQCFKMGSFQPLFHSGEQYQVWFDACMELKRKSALLSCCQAHGFTRFDYLSDLKNEIEKGEAIYKYSYKMSPADKRIVGTLLNDLKMLEANEITKREAQKGRKTPFSVLLYGGSSIGKSTLTNMHFYQYGKLFGLRTEAEYCYTRIAADPFWSGFNSTQWCVVLDDIAYVHPNKAPNGDPTLMETIQVINRVSFVPNQAELQDKGRTPVRAELVLATTNCADLNAFHYFQTPLALQRRLPFMVDVQPKPQYTKNGCMLDSTKVDFVDGQWPDYWIFKVHKVVPATQKRERATGKFELIHTFDNVDDYLAWFSSEAKKHEKSQQIVDICDNAMATIEICQLCYRNKLKCQCNVQSYELTLRNIEPQVSYGDRIKYLFVLFLLFILRSDIIVWFLTKIFRSSYIEDLVVDNIFEPAKANQLRDYFGHLGNKVEQSVGDYKKIGKIVAGVTAVLVVYKSASYFRSLFTPTPKTNDVQGVQEDPVKESEPSVKQFASNNIGRAPTSAKEEGQNFWFKDDFELTTFEISNTSASWKGLDVNVVIKKIQKNCIHLDVYRTDKSLHIPIRATAIAGHIYVTNNHAFLGDGPWNVSIVQGSTSGGVTRNITVKMASCDLYRIPSRDLCFFKLRNLPPASSVADLFPLARIGGCTKGFYVGRNIDGSPYLNALAKVEPNAFELKDESRDFHYNSEYLRGYSDVRTKTGDCGSIYVAQTPRGPTLMGIHFVGGADFSIVGVSPITQKDINDATIGLQEIVVQSSEPALEAKSASQTLSVLHKKSTVRYIEDGCANVYGSIVGFRAAPKSHVVPTIISDEAEKAGYKVQHGKPVMSGWEPWRIAALDMVNPVTQFDNAILTACVDSFIADIMGNFSKEDFNDIHVLDDVTTVNGAPGVKYVDKLNRNTSAGFPWKKSKKFFLNPLPDDGVHTDAVMPTEEIMERMNNIINKYHKGERAMPVFTGHLKDEATKFKKIEAKKTRVFTGAPMDWSLVVRKYLLTTIRFMQNNKYTFECAPGTNPMSTEWTELYSYLTKFGKDRMIAGDYAAFDKRMSSNVILAAYDIIIHVCAAAGYSPDDLRVIKGIAEDTAFPLVDFNGDLIEFYGSNPSGHPLTVIINCLANSLYIRYCWAVIMGVDKLPNFKKQVALMTYGDDNVMGVAREVQEFNHTSISNVLAGVGITYTMADKESESVPFIPIEEVSFLKRTWRWEEELNAYACPLEEASIAKMLTRVVESKTVPPEKQAVDVLSCATREYFAYGKEKFLERRAVLKRIADTCKLDLYVEPSTFPTWDEMIANFN